MTNLLGTTVCSSPSHSQAQGEELQLFPLPVSKATLLQVQVSFATEEEVGVSV